jgi:hypothetical protein
MIKIGKFKIDGKMRIVYKMTFTLSNRTKYFYRENGYKTFIKKPKEYNNKFSRTNKKTKSYKFNPNSKKKSFDVYIDKNPKDTIPIKYKTVKDVKATIRKLERLFKSGKYTHKRIWQVGMIMYVRLRAMKGKTKQKALAKRYFNFLRKRTKEKGKDSDETFRLRKKMTFKFN